MTHITKFPKKGARIEYPPHVIDTYATVHQARETTAGLGSTRKVNERGVVEGTQVANETNTCESCWTEIDLGQTLCDVCKI